MTTIRSIMIGAALLTWAGTAVAQGLYWESQTTGAGAGAHNTKAYAMPKMMKLVQDGGREVIVRSDKDVIIVIDPAKQSYREMSVAELESTAKAMQPQMEAAMAKMKERMADMPPDQRAMMEKMMPQIAGGAAGKSGPVTVQKTGETKTIAGLPCTKYVATEGGKPILTAWTTTEAPGFDKLKDDWTAMQKRFAAINRSFGGASDAYSQIQGFPMETEIGGTKTVVTKVESRTTPATAFEAPSAFTKEANPLPKLPPQ